jgi:tRNA(adenine34) deaminase
MEPQRHTVDEVMMRRCIGRVVYALSSPVMGGVSKWAILRDREIAGLIPIFGPAPEIVDGLLQKEAQDVWRQWNPLAWQLIGLRGVLTAVEATDKEGEVLPAHAPSLWHCVMRSFTWLSSRSHRRPRVSALPVKEFHR